MIWKTDHSTISKELIDLYLDGRISDLNKEKVEAHIAECESCSEYVMFNQQLKNLANSEEAKPEKNPFFYSELMNKIDGVSRKPRFSGVKIAFACGLVSVLLLTIAYPLFNSAEDPKTVSYSSNLIGASPSTHYLLSDLTQSDVLYFWKENALPLDQTKNEYVLINRNQNGIPSLTFTGNNCAECSEIKSIRSILTDAHFNDETISNIESVFEKFSNEIRSGLLIDKTGRFLVNPSVFEVRSKMNSELSNLTDLRILKSIVFSRFNHSDKTNYSAFTISLPQRSDKVSISDENKTAYLLINVDPFTVKSLRQSIPKLGRIIAPDFERQELVAYQVVAKNDMIYPLEMKSSKTELASGKKQDAAETEENGMTIIEANRIMTALKRGLSPDEVIAYKAEFEKYLDDYSKLSKEVRNQYSGKENEERFKVYIPQSQRINIVGFGNSQQNQTPKVKKSTSTITVDHQ